MFVRVPLSNTDGKMSAPIRTSIWELSKNVGSARGMAGKSINASRGIGHFTVGPIYNWAKKTWKEG